MKAWDALPAEEKQRIRGKNWARLSPEEQIEDDCFLAHMSPEFREELLKIQAES